MNHPALPEKLGAPGHRIGDGSSPYTKVMSQPVVAGAGSSRWMAAFRSPALDAASGSRIWQVDLRPRMPAATPLAADRRSGTTA